MRLTPLLLSFALVVGLAAPVPVFADKASDSAAAGLILGLILKGAIDRNRRAHAQAPVPDQVFYPADMPGVTCYTKAQQCYYKGNYSARATRAVFWN
jgi:hypothetical protein